MFSIINFFRILKNLIVLGDSISAAQVNNKGDVVISFKSNVLLSTPESFGIYAENNYIVESKLSATNTLGKYTCARHLQNTAALMSSSYTDITVSLPKLQDASLMYRHPVHINNAMYDLISKC